MTPKTNLVPIQKIEPNKERNEALANMLLGLVDRARSGELTSIHAAICTETGQVERHSVGEYTRTELVGSLELMKLSILFVGLELSHE